MEVTFSYMKMPDLVVAASSAGVTDVHKAKSVLFLVQNGEHVCKMHPLYQGLLPPLSTYVDTDIVHVINAPRPPPSIFAYCKCSKTGQWEGLGTRLSGRFKLDTWPVHC